MAGSEDQSSRRRPSVKTLYRKTLHALQLKESFKDRWQAFEKNDAQSTPPMPTRRPPPPPLNSPPVVPTRGASMRPKSPSSPTAPPLTGPPPSTPPAPPSPKKGRHPISLPQTPTPSPNPLPSPPPSPQPDQPPKPEDGKQPLLDSDDEAMHPFPTISVRTTKDGESTRGQIMKRRGAISRRGNRSVSSSDNGTTRDPYIVSASPQPQKNKDLVKPTETGGPHEEDTQPEIGNYRTVRFSSSPLICEDEGPQKGPLDVSDANPSWSDRTAVEDEQSTSNSPKQPREKNKPYHEAAWIIRRRATKASQSNLFHNRTEKVPLLEAVGRIAAQRYYTVEYRGPAKGVATDSDTRPNVMSVAFLVSAQHETFRKEILVGKGEVIKQNHLLSLAYGNSEINILPEAKVLVYTLDNAPSVIHMEHYLKSTLHSLATIYEGVHSCGVVSIQPKQLKHWTKEEAPLEWSTTDLIVLLRDPENSPIEPTLELINKYGKVHVDGIKMDPGGATVFGTLKFGNHRTGILVIPSQPIEAALTCWRMLVIRYLYAYMGLRVPRHLVSDAKPLPSLIESAANIPANMEAFRAGKVVLTSKHGVYFSYDNGRDELTRLSESDSWARFGTPDGGGAYWVQSKVRCRPFTLRVEDLERREEIGGGYMSEASNASDWM